MATRLKVFCLAGWGARPGVAARSGGKAGWAGYVQVTSRAVTTVQV
jgi:hypothetical protein